MIGADDQPASGFYFIRHGQTVDNERQVRSGGDREVDLTAGGLAQAQAAAACFAATGRRCGLIIASPLRRTATTAGLFAEALGVPVLYQDWLRERALGDWNGLAIAETQPWLKAGQTPPGGESEDVFTQRITHGLASVSRFLPDQPLLVGSKGVGRILFKILADGLTVEVGNCEIIEFSLYQRDEVALPGSMGDGLISGRWRFVRERSAPSCRTSTDTAIYLGPER